MRSKITIEMDNKTIETYLIQHPDGTFSINSADKNKLFNWFIDEIIGNFVDNKIKVEQERHKDLMEFNKKD